LDELPDQAAPGNDAAGRVPDGSDRPASPESPSSLPEGSTGAQASGSPPEEPRSQPEGSTAPEEASPAGSEDGPEPANPANPAKPAAVASRFAFAGALGRRFGKRAVVVIVVVCLLIGSAGVARILLGTAPGSTPGAGQATATATVSAALSAAGTSAALTETSSAAAQATATHEAVATAIHQTSPTAAITFNDLVLDPSVDKPSAPLTFSFVSDGPGSVSVQVVSSTAMNSTKLCLAVDGAAAACVSGVAPAFPAEIATTDHSRWTVTVASADEGTPAVDVAFSWPTRNAVMVLTNGRFQGSPNPDSLRSMTATFTARAAGAFSLEAAWPPVAVNATLTLSNAAGSGQSVVDKVGYSDRTSLIPAYVHPVDAGKVYRVELMNDSPDSLRPNLTATIAFP
jgi:hypothetical protein